MVFPIQKLAAFHTDISMNHDMTTTQGKLLALRMMIIITMTIIFKAKIRAQFVPLVEFMSLVIYSHTRYKTAYLIHCGNYLACQVRVTVGDTGLCCCVCVTSFER